MLPASLAACVPVFMATPTSAWASAGASLVPSPVMATSLPLACSSLMSAHLGLGRGLGQEVVDARLARRWPPRCSGLSPVIMTVRMPMARKRGEALADAALDHVLEVDDAEHLRVPVGHDQRRAALVGDAVGDLLELRRHRAALRARPRPRRRRPRPCGSGGRRGRSRSSGSGPRRGRTWRRERLRSRPRRPNCSLASTTTERPSGVSSARKASCAASASSLAGTPSTGSSSKDEVVR